MITKLLLVLVLMMMAITSIGLVPSFASFIFAGGSDELLHPVSGNMLIQFLLVFCFAAFILIYRAKSKLRAALLIIFFILWVLSGRVVGLFPDGRLSAGWF
jgi:hypothetical protein